MLRTFLHSSFIVRHSSMDIHPAYTESYLVTYDAMAPPYLPYRIPGDLILFDCL